MPTTVVNRHVAPFDVDIGRPGPWGNPFRIGRDGDRDAVILKFFEYWYAPEQAALRARARRELTGTVLGCWCPPLRCHGHVIAAYCDAVTANTCPECGWRWEDEDPVAGIIHRTRICGVCWGLAQEAHARD